MSSVNSVTLLGNVGKDPEIRSSQDGKRFASFTIATSENWKDKATGERKEKTEWTNVSVTNDALVSIVERFVKKGSKLYLVGQLQTRKWTDNNGADRYSTEVVLKPFKGELVLLDAREQGETKQNTSYQAPEPTGTTSFIADLDEIPFGWVIAFIISLLPVMGIA